MSMTSGNLFLQPDQPKCALQLITYLENIRKRYLKVAFRLVAFFVEFIFWKKIFKSSMTFGNLYFYGKYVKAIFQT